MTIEEAEAVACIIGLLLVLYDIYDSGGMR